MRREREGRRVGKHRKLDFMALRRRREREREESYPRSGPFGAPHMNPTTAISPVEGASTESQHTPRNREDARTTRVTQKRRIKNAKMSLTKEERGHGDTDGT